MTMVRSTTANERVKYIILSLHEVDCSFTLFGDDGVVRVDPLPRKLKIVGNEGITISFSFLYRFSSNVSSR